MCEQVICLSGRQVDKHGEYHTPGVVCLRHVSSQEREARRGGGVHVDMHLLGERYGAGRYGWFGEEMGIDHGEYT
jgi:hypothetical protein